MVTAVKSPALPRRHLIVEWWLQTLFGIAVFFAFTSGVAKAITSDSSAIQTTTSSLSNSPPRVYAGLNQRIALGESATLRGSYTDDGLPLDGSVTTTWVKQFGPGTVTFSNANALETSASFTEPGKYRVILTVNDGKLQGTAAIEVEVVDKTSGTGLVIDTAGWGGPEKHYSYSATQGDFELKQSGKVVGVTFTSSDKSITWVLNFAAPYEAPLGVGKYSGVVKYPNIARSRSKMQIGNLFNGDSGTFEVKKIIYGTNGTVISFWATFADTPWLTGEIKFNAGSTAPSINQAPFAFVKKASGDERVLINKPVNWFGNAFDDAQPSPEALTQTWSTVRGPASAIFGDPSAEVTTITFPKAGFYKLRFTASDGEYSASDDTEFEVIDPKANTLVRFQDGGEKHLYNQNNAVIHVSRYENGIDVYVKSLKHENDEHSFLFRVPEGSDPSPGFYAHTGPDYSYSEPDFEYTENSTTTGGGTTGAFLIKQIEFGTDNSVTAFWVTFKMGPAHRPWLTGEIRFNAAKNVTLGNFAPFVDAGEDHTLRNGGIAFLEGFAADDGELAGGRITTRWSMVSGPGKVAFKNAAARLTSATFSAPGTYVLRLTATDGRRSAFDELSVTQSAEITSLRIVSTHGDEVGGGAVRFFTPRNGNFKGSGWNNSVQIEFETFGGWDPTNPSSHQWRLEFGAPTGETLKPGLYSAAGPWSEAGQPKLNVSGDQSPVNSFGSFHIHQFEYGTNGELISFWATFTQADSYSSGDLTGEIRYNTLGSWPDIEGPNQPPIVKATATAPYQSKSILKGSAIDDDLPYRAKVSTRWSVASGPGVVTFVDATLLATEATFSTPGSYVLRLTGSDGSLSASTDLSVVVPNESFSEEISAGAYSGLIITTGARSFHGSARLTLNKSGSFSGNVRFGNVLHAFSGAFSFEGTWSGLINVPGAAALTLSLAKSQNGQISGTISNGVATANIALESSRYNSLINEYDMPKGRYSFAMLRGSEESIAPYGHGIGVMAISTPMRFRLAAVLPDGSRASAGGILGGRNTIAFDTALSGRSGRLAGLIPIITKEKNFRLDFQLGGNVVWTKTAANGTTKFSSALTFVGSRFTGPVFSLGLVRAGEPNAQLTIENPSWPEPRSVPLLVQSQRQATKITFLEKGSGITKVTLDSASALLSGTYIDPITKKSGQLFGVMLQGQHAAYGFSVGKDGSVGKVELQPYP